MKCQKLIYKSPVFGSVSCLDLPYEEDRHVDFGPRTALALYNRGPEVLMYMTEQTRNLVDFVPEELEGLVLRADFGILEADSDKLFLLTEIYVRDEPTEDQHQQIADWISGQLSDGWGEGVEQRPVMYEEVTIRTPVFDRFDAVFTTEDAEVTAEYYLHPWAMERDWTLFLVGREPAELDIEELDLNEELRQAILKIKELVDEIVEELKKVT